MSKEILHLPRSPRWPELRRRWIIDHPRCAACGGSRNVQVHHKIPVHVARSLELDPKNLISLCENQPRECHFRLGHLHNWYNYNRNIEKQAADELLATYATDPKTPAPAPQPLLPPITPADAPNPNPAAAADPLDDPLPPVVHRHNSYRRKRR